MVRLMRTMANINNALQVLKSILPLDELPRTQTIEGSSMSEVLQPHEFFHWLLRASPRRFANHLGGVEMSRQA